MKQNESCWASNEEKKRKKSSFRERYGKNWIVACSQKEEAGSGGLECLNERERIQ